jgi:hypothetical protein
MNDLLLGKPSIEMCPDCNNILWYNNVGDLWCLFGYSNNEELSETIRGLNMIVVYKKQQSLEDIKLKMAIGFGVFWIGMLVFWLLVS